MLFFTSQAPNNVTSPILFKDHGNPGNVPTVPTECGVTHLPIGDLKPYRAFFQFYYPCIVAGRADKKNYGEARVCYDITSAEVPAAFMNDYPDVGVSFANNLSQEAQDAALKYGLSRESSGRRTYYKGHLNVDQAQEILRLGGDPDAYLPYGVSNVAGLLTFHALRRLIYFSFCSFPKEFNAVYPKAQFEATPNASIKILEAGDELYGKPYFLISHAPKKSGHVCPYFDGMLLPDKLIASEVLSTLGLSRLLSTTPLGCTQALSAIKRGWKSLCFTRQGMELSHILYGLKLGLLGGFRPAMLFGDNKQYKGLVLIGDGAILKGAQLIERTSPSTTRTLCEGLDSHARGLKELAAIFNNLEQEEGVTYTPEVFTSPRFIHRIIQRFKITPEQRAEIKKALNLLDFPQKYWNPMDPQNILRAVRLIKSGVRPEDSEPYPYRSELFFSNSLYHEVLAVFGEKVPCISVLEAEGRFQIIKNQKPQGKKGASYENLSLRKVSVTHLPVFHLSLQQAASVWERILRDKLLVFNSKNGRPQGVVQSFPEASVEAQAILQELGKKSSAEKAASGSKRKREEDNKEPSAIEVQRMVKKMKKMGMSAEQFMSLMGSTSGGTTTAGDQGDESEMDI